MEKGGCKPIPSIGKIQRQCTQRILVQIQVLYKEYYNEVTMLHGYGSVTSTRYGYGDIVQYFLFLNLTYWYAC